MINYVTLLQRQSLPLDAKIAMSISRIHEWYSHWYGKVYVSFSGGKDSTVLLHIVRSIYPDIPAVFSNTGMEYPEIVKFVRTTNNVTWIKPKMNFKEVIKKYGWPVVSKEVSQKIYEARTTKSAKLLHKRLHGDDNKYKSGRIPLKWQYLIDAPFAISHKCCDVLKKKPFAEYEKTSGRLGMVGTMAADSHLRKQTYLRNGCNSFEGKLQSRPLSTWNDADIWNYITKFNIKYCDIYDKGYQSTGCAFCAFGVHMEASPNRFQLMQSTHPKLWDYCIKRLGMNEILDILNIPYSDGQTELELK